MWFGNIFQLKGVLRCYYRKQKGLDFPTIYSHDIYFSLDMKIVVVTTCRALKFCHVILITRDPLTLMWNGGNNKTRSNPKTLPTTFCLSRA